MKFRFGELFCGPGGLSFGAMRARFTHKGVVYANQHAFATDMDPDSCRTYANNICNGDDSHVYCRNIHEMDLEALPDIDALAFGFPCNDFSIVGEQQGVNGHFGGLYQYGRDVLSIKNPIWFAAENVNGLQSADDGKTFKIILKELANAGESGYNLTAHLYKFEEYRVPQKRHRIIIVGIRNDTGLQFEVPAPVTPSNFRTARQALEDPPIGPDVANNEFTRHQRQVIERLDHIPEGKNAWYEGLPEHLRLNVQGAFLSQIYRRLIADEPAYTITGSGGGGTHGYHWAESRALTNRERARLQTFPDSFVFSGGKESVRKQIGMAVPPDGIKIIIEAIFKTFAGVSYSSAQPHWGNS
jgi:DNA (cytosine-5)-methyltransferase 1